MLSLTACGGGGEGGGGGAGGTIGSPAQPNSVVAPGPIIVASVDSLGVLGNLKSFNSSLSGDGRYVAFASWANNLVPDDINSDRDIFVRDIQTGETTVVSVDSSGAMTSGNKHDPSISGDGRYVSFRSLADNLVGVDLNGAYDIFIAPAY